MTNTLTVTEAINRLPEGEFIHTFRNPGGMLLGSDWKREEIIDTLNEALEIRRTMGMAQRMGHGIVVDTNGPLFIQTKEEGICPAQ